MLGRKPETDGMYTNNPVSSVMFAHESTQIGGGSLGDDIGPGNTTSMLETTKFSQVEVLPQ